MADVITGNTQLAATKQDLIAAIVQKELQFKAKLLSYVTDVSQFCVPGAKSIAFPKLTSFTVIDRASAAAGDASVLTASTDVLDLEWNAYVAWIIDSSDEIQSAIPAQLEFARRAASAHGRFVDEKIIAELETVGVATTTAGDISRDIVLEMRKALLKRNADLDQAALVISPDQEEFMLKVAQFTEAQIYGSSNVPSGMIGSVYGVPVVVHNGLGVQQYFMFEKNGLAVGFQKAPAMSEQMANEYGTAAKRVAMDQLFGVQGLEIAQAGVGAGLSALVVKDNN